ncbi:hypothetical protein ACFLQW_00840 [Candidatus Zixiibacteriota bacterium]
MEQRLHTMRLQISGSWTAADLVKSFSNINDLYNLVVVFLLVKGDFGFRSPDNREEVRCSLTKTFSGISELRSEAIRVASISREFQEYSRLFVQSELEHSAKFRDFQRSLGRFAEKMANFDDYLLDLTRRMEFAGDKCLLLPPREFTLRNINLLLDPERWHQLAEMITPDEQLIIIQIRYGSPGFADLAGVGEAIKHIKDFLEFIVEKWTSVGKRKLEREEHKLRNDNLRIENARNLLQLAKDCGCGEADLRRMLPWVLERQDTLISMAEDGALQAPRLLSDGEAGARGEKES